jgi:DNA-binding MarR family transcriptional regulator
MLDFSSRGPTRRSPEFIGVESSTHDDIRLRMSPCQETHIDIGTSVMDRAILNLRALILAGERYRQMVAGAIGLGTTERQALSYLEVHGSSGQAAMARDLGITSSALTPLVDRLERHGVAERVRHPRDRRRTIVRVTERGMVLLKESHQWLDATLELIDPADLELVSASLAIITEDLAVRTGGNDVGDAHPTPAPRATFRLTR